MNSDEEYWARFLALPCCGHVVAVHSDDFRRCLSTAGMDPDEHCDCPKYEKDER